MRNKTTADSEKKSFLYGFSIRPESFCRVIHLESNEELLLSPNQLCIVPWNREEVKIIRAEPLSLTEFPREEIIMDTIIKSETLDWLRVSEGAFRFWDNEIDELWNDV